MNVPELSLSCNVLQDCCNLHCHHDSHPHSNLLSTATLDLTLKIPFTRPDTNLFCFHVLLVLRVHFLAIYTAGVIHGSTMVHIKYLLVLQPVQV